jgi:hypothetical protein
MGRTKEAWMLMNEYNSLKESLAMDEDEYFQTYRVIKDEHEVQILEDKLKLLSEELGKYDLQVQPDIDLRRSDN